MELQLKCHLKMTLNCFLAQIWIPTSCLSRGRTIILEISGSGDGIVLSGSAVYIDQKMGVNMPNGQITHAITLPDKQITLEE